MTQRGWCAQCQGFGWRDATEDEIQEQLRLDGQTDVHRRLAILRNSAVPCDICEPRQHQLWKDGHLRPGHRCETCRPTRPSPRRRKQP